VTEEEWHTTNLARILRWLPTVTPTRKLRLFSDACVAKLSTQQLTASEYDRIHAVLTCESNERMVELARHVWARQLKAHFGSDDVGISLVRDIFGNPFRRIEFSPAWKTQNVIDLATTIFNDNAFDRMPILADALMDAGCEDETIINHCRHETHHVRGCWLVDEIMGKGWSYVS
jgi:hypothetical protein